MSLLLEPKFVYSFCHLEPRMQPSMHGTEDTRAARYRSNAYLLKCTFHYRIDHSSIIPGVTLAQDFIRTLIIETCSKLRSGSLKPEVGTRFYKD